MSTTELRPTTGADALAAARRLAPAIAARAAEVEAARRVPGDLLDELATAGCIGPLRPLRHGGSGMDLVSALGIYETLARADASVAWTAMITGESWLDLAALPLASFDALFTRGGRTLFAGAFNPTGTITPAPGGYRVTGRWSFASGCQDADWIFGNCVEGVVDGVPDLRLAVFDPADVVIEDTWHVSGLRGTGSHHFSVTDVFVPAERTLRPLVDEPCLEEPVARIAPPGLYGMHIGAVAIGAAQGSLDDIVALSRGKVPLLGAGPLAADPLFQAELGTADTALRAARALLHQTAGQAWAAAVAAAVGDEPMGWDLRAAMRSAGVFACSTAVDVAAMAYRAGGGSSLYADCPLQRRLRDVHAITQHFLVKRGTMATVGAVLTGREVAVPVF